MADGLPLTERQIKGWFLAQALFRQRASLFLLAAIFLFGTAVSTTWAHRRWRVEGESVEDAFGRLFDAERLSYRSDRFPAIASAALILAEADKRRQEPGDVVDCIGDERSHAWESGTCRAVRSLERIWNELGGALAQSKSVGLRDLEGAFAGMDADAVAKAEASLVKLLGEARRCLADPKECRNELGKCCPDGLDRCAQRIPDERARRYMQWYGEASCSAGSTLSSLLLPATISQLSFRDTILGALGLRRRQDQRILEAQAISRLIEPLAELLKPAVPFGAQPPAIIQLYFVSPDSLLRFWSVDGKDAWTQFVASPRWSETGYYQSLQDRALAQPGPMQKKTVHTPPYIDFNEFGFVRTVCVALPREEGGLHGIFCVDYTVPLTQKSIQKGGTDLFRFVRVNIDREVSGSGAPVVNIDDRPLVEERLGLSATELESHLQKVPNAWDTLRAAQPVEIGNIKVFTLPYGRSKTQSQLLVLRPRQSRSLWVFLIPSFSFGLFLAIVFYGAAVARAKDRERFQHVVLRHLQVGVIREDRDGYLVAANDRAEEILERPLPTMGAEREEVGVKILFADLIDASKCWKEKKDGGYEAKSKTYAVLMEERERGDSFAYVTRLAASGSSWIRVHGSPFLSTGDRSPKFGHVEQLKGRPDGLEDPHD